jgi:hypothetical protein
MGKIFWGLYSTLEAGARQLLYIAVRLGRIELYQPLWGRPASIGGASRSCADRWEKMRRHLPSNPFSFLDIGSQLGYFSMAATKAGGLALGMERVKAYNRLARAIQTENKIETVGFFNLEVNPKTVAMLPHFDVVCCLSVFHHWVLDWGQEGAEEILRQLCLRARRQIYFESGQPDEVTQAFAKSLNFMTAGFDEWARAFLRKNGFTRIENLGQFPTHLSDVQRTLLVAFKE